MPLDAVTVNVRILPEHERLQLEAAAQACRGAIFSALVLAQVAGATALVDALGAVFQDALAYERSVTQGSQSL